ncbi:MAG: hypothetical protein WA970_08905 [Gammaproteobacteria bacterium]
MVDVSKHTDELLDLYSKELPESSKTAAAIKRGASWTDISQTAEKEGLHYISNAIFVAEEERFAGEPTAASEPAIDTVAAERVRDFRKHLPDSCETAAAIDRNAPWSEIAQCAQRDGLHEIASFIFEAEQQGLED